MTDNFDDFDYWSMRIFGGHFWTKLFGTKVFLFCLVVMFIRDTKVDTNSLDTLGRLFSEIAFFIFLHVISQFFWETAYDFSKE